MLSLGSQRWDENHGCKFRYWVEGEEGEGVKWERKGEQATTHDG